MSAILRRFLVSTEFALRFFVALAALITTGCMAIQQENSTRVAETEQVAAMIAALAHPSDTPTPFLPTNSLIPSITPTNSLVPSSTPTVFLSTQSPEETSDSGMPFGYRNLTPGLYVVYVGTDNETYAISVEGNSLGEPIARIPSMAMSPDEMHILYNDNYHLRILDLLSGQTSNLPGINKCYGGWSPDGNQIVCGGGDIYVTTLGSDQWNLVTTWSDQAVDTWWFPAWSPNGKWIAFRNFGNLNSEGGKPTPNVGLYLTDTSCLSDISTCKEKTRGPFAHDLMSGGFFPPTWSPDSRYLAFASDSAIYDLDVESGAVNLIAPEDYIVSLVWSPDNRWFAYTGYDGGVYILPVSGGKSARLATGGWVDSWLTIPLPSKK
jgi:Tol biopolymer transport system component